jgi:hypothetical protein
MTDLSDLVSQIFTPWKPGFAELFRPLQISAVEVTQAIQFCRAAEHLTDPADRGADNSLTLVADKPAVVRVYLHGGLKDVPNVRVTVTQQRRRYGIWVDAGTLTPMGAATITAFRNAPYDSERGALAGSVNYLVPGDVMVGEMRLKVHAAQVGHPELSADTTVMVYASLRQTLKLRGVPVQYWGPDNAGNQVKLAAPTQADFVSGCAWTCNAWPVSPRPDVTLAGTFTWQNPLTGNMANGSCPTSWNDLLYWLKVARTLDGNLPDHFYYAMLPKGVPIGDTGGCGSPGGVGAGFVNGNSGTTLAHELGHVLTFAHVFGYLPADDNKWDTSYPVYEPYETAATRRGSIGEYGFDVTTSTIMNPTWSTDFMGYGPQPWMSPYHHRLMIENPRLAPTWVPVPRGTLAPLDVEVPVVWPPVPPNPPDPPWGEWTERVRPPEIESLVSVFGRRIDGRVEMSHVLRLEAFGGGEGTPVDGMRVQLVDVEGAVVAQAPVLEYGTSGCGCGCGGGGGGRRPDDDVVLVANVPDPGEGHQFVEVRLVQGDEQVWRREAPAHPPRVTAAEAGIDGDLVHIRWGVELAEDAAQADRFVRWSADGGITWSLLALGTEGDETAASVESMAAGPALVQVLVSDGFHTVASDPVRVEVPWRRPSVAVMWPRAEAPVAAGAPLRLWAAATACDGTALDGEAMQWFLDGERVAVGADQWLRVDLLPGEHRAQVRAHDGQATADAEVVFVVRGPGRDVG